MRTRKSFQPSIEIMPLRLAPSSSGVLPNPMNPLTDPGTTSSPLINPMNPLTDPGVPSSSCPSYGSGSYTSPTATTPIMLC